MARRSADPTSLYKMDDYLNKLSIDQLRSELQRPTGGAPAFMVASKLQEKLREKSAAAQRPASTVAEDLMGGQAAMQRPQEAGINSLMPRDPARTVAMMPRDVAADHEMEPMAMAHGGIVKMAGGAPVYGQGGEFSNLDVQNYNAATSGSLLFGDPDVISGYPGIFQASNSPSAEWGNLIKLYQRQFGLSPTDAARKAALWYSQSKTPTPIPSSQDTEAARSALAAAGISADQQALINKYPGIEVVSDANSSSQAPSSPTSSAAVSPQAAQQQLIPGDYPQASQEPPISPSAYPAAQDSAGLPIPPNPPAGGAPPRATGIRSLPGGGGASGGLGGAGGGGAGGLPSGAGEAPTGPLQDAINRMRLSDERMQKLSELATKGPTTQERRQEAINMALLQAGLGMMQPGQSNALAAISRGAIPALQQLGENFRYIRKEDQDNIMNQLKIENQSALNAFHQGTIGYHIYDTQVKENIARATQAAHLAAASITAGGRQAAQQATNAFRDLQIGTRQFGTMNALASKEDASAAALRKEIIAIQNNQMDSPERKKAISDREALIKQHTDMASQYRINGYLIGQKHGIVPELTIDRGNQNNTSTNLPFAQEEP